MLRMTRPVIGAVVVSYGDAAPARAAVRSLMAGDEAPRYVVVVHNGPGPFGEWGDARRLERAGDVTVKPEPGVTLVETGRNLGYARGLALGVSLIEASARPDYVWLLNNDIVVHPGALRALRGSAAADPSVGMWGCTLCTDPTFTRVESVGARFSRWTTHTRPVLSGLPVAALLRTSQSPRVDFVIGASMFMPHSAYTACGGMPADYFMYYEELDIVARLRAAGKGLGWCREALVAHGGGLATGAAGRSHVKSAAVAYHSMRSALVYTRMRAPCALPSVLFSRLLRNVCYEGLAGSPVAARAALRGCLDGLAVPLQRKRP
jgi:GT2 family glycosyltransferase